jgi:hypothetical protein
MLETVLLLKHLQELFCHEEPYQESIVSASPLPRLAIRAQLRRILGADLIALRYKPFRLLSVLSTPSVNLLTPLAFPPAFDIFGILVS